MIRSHQKSDELLLLEELFAFIIPKYREAHDMIIAMLEFEPSQEVRVVDLGCGFGDLTRRIIDTYPLSTVFGIDIEPHILARAKEKLEDSADQFLPIEQDLNNNAWMHDMINIHAVVSSFTLDYLAKKRHQEIIKECYQLLETGGRWVSCEFFRSHDNRVNRVFHDLEITFIQNALKNNEITEQQIDQLGQSTILRKKHNICTVEDKIKWLHETGFKLVDVPWRFLNLAVISAKK